MGRIKRGLDYFPMSTDFIHDRMVRRVMKHEGDSAFVILVETFSYIYSGNGYYVSADEEFYDELSDNLFNTELEDVKRIIASSVEYGLFDAELFRKYNILTSADVQRQYLFVTKRRSGSLIAAEYCLLETEELASYRSSKKSKDGLPASDNRKEAKGLEADVATESGNVVTSIADDAAREYENATLSTQNKREQNKEKQKKTYILPDPPQGGSEGGNFLRKKKEMTQEEIDCMQAPNDGVQRNLRGLVENLRLYKVPPAEQYAILLKSNFGVIGSPVWKGIRTIYDSCGKIKLPGHYLLSVIK